MPYARLEPSGCGTYKNRTKLRIDLFLNENDPHFDKYYVYVPVISEGGYLGKVNETGSLVDPEDRQKWLDSLPHTWQVNSFHSHFIYPNKDITDAELKAQIENYLSYFYQFYQYCWNNGFEFIDNWKKVPKVKGSIRDVFIAADVKELSISEAKVADILSRKEEFLIGISKVPPQDLNISEEGTIVIGSAAINRTGTTGAINENTYVTSDNPAGATGSLDLIEIWIEGSEGTLDVFVGTFSASGDVLTCRDSESVGNVAAGSKQQFTGLSIAVETDDYIGIHSKSAARAWLEATFPGPGIWTYEGENIDPSDSTSFGWFVGRTLSLYGTGEEVGVGGQPYISRVQGVQGMRSWGGI